MKVSMKQYMHVINLMEGGAEYKGHFYAGYHCPGCNDTHVLPVQPQPDGKGWTWNQDLDKPVFGPSVLVTSGHFVQNFNPAVDHCWCTFKQRYPDEEEEVHFRCYRCHSFVGCNGAQPGEVIILGDSSVPAGVFKLATFRHA